MGAVGGAGGTTTTLRGFGYAHVVAVSRGCVSTVSTIVRDRIGEDAEGNFFAIFAGGPSR